MDCSALFHKFWASLQMASNVQLISFFGSLHLCDSYKMDENDWPTLHESVGVVLARLKPTFLPTDTFLYNDDWYSYFADRYSDVRCSPTCDGQYRHWVRRTFASGRSVFRKSKGKRSAMKNQTYHSYHDKTGAKRNNVVTKSGVVKQDHSWQTTSRLSLKTAWFHLQTEYLVCQWNRTLGAKEVMI